MSNETLVRNALESLQAGHPQPLLDLMVESTEWHFPDSQPETLPLLGKEAIRDHLAAKKFGTPNGPAFGISHVEDMDDFVVAEVVHHFRHAHAEHRSEYWTYAVDIAEGRVVAIRAYEERDY